MSLFGNSNRPISVQQPELRGYRATTSVFGAPIPLVYGQNRIAGSVIWYGDWQAIPVQQATYGKGGPSAAAGNQWTYQAALIIALCQGPIVGMGNVWDGTSELNLVSAGENYTIPNGGGSYQVVNHANFAHDWGGARQDPYSVTANDYGSPGAVTLAGTQKTPMTLTGGAPGAGQYSLNAATGTYTFSAADAGKTVVINYVYSIPNSNSNGLPTNVLSLSLFTGSQGQAAWGYMTSNHPSQALGYTEVAYVTNPTFALGSSGSLPNLTFEIMGLKRFGAGIVDALPTDVIYDLLTASYGALIPASYVGDMTAVKNYCLANGIFISPAITGQQSASELIKSYLMAANAEAVWSEGLIKFVSRGDTTAVGNGATFTPSTQPIYDLDDDDFLESGSSDPVQVMRPSVADAYNSIKLQWSNRSNSYNHETIEEKDDWSIGVYGLRALSPVTADFICTQAVAQAVANTMLKNSVYVRAQYKFTLGWQYCLLEPMDMVTITDVALGLNKAPVRILSIEENDNGDLAFTAEEFPWSVSAPTLYPKQGVTPYVPQATADPGNSNTPIVFELTNRISGQKGYTLGVGVSGGANWGGCHVWMSTDNLTYKQIGEIAGNSRMGVLLAALAAHADPDTTDTLSIDLGESRGQLSSGTQANADAFLTLCLVDNELLSFETATLATGNQYNLTYLRRGILGSTVGAHAIGAAFLRIDDAVFQYGFDPTLIGKTIYLKFTGFNPYGLMEQALANVTAHSYTIQGLSTGVVDLSTGNVNAPVVQVGGKNVAIAPILATESVTGATLAAGGASTTVTFTDAQVTAVKTTQSITPTPVGTYPASWYGISWNWTIPANGSVEITIVNNTTASITYATLSFNLSIS